MFWLKKENTFLFFITPNLNFGFESVLNSWIAFLEASSLLFLNSCLKLGSSLYETHFWIKIDLLKSEEEQSLFHCIILQMAWLIRSVYV